MSDSMLWPPADETIDARRDEEKKGRERSRTAPDGIPARITHATRARDRRRFGFPGTFFFFFLDSDVNPHK